MSHETLDANSDNAPTATEKHDPKTASTIWDAKNTLHQHRISRDDKLSPRISEFFSSGRDSFSRRDHEIREAFNALPASERSAITKPERSRRRKEAVTGAPLLALGASPVLIGMALGAVGVGKQSAPNHNVDHKTDNPVAQIAENHAGDQKAPAGVSLPDRSEVLEGIDKLHK